MKNCIICGSRFGQFYIEAIRKHDDINICGLLANGSQRSVDCAEFYQLNLYTHIDEILRGNMRSYMGSLEKINVILQFAIYIVDCHQYKILSKIIKS